MNKNVTIEGIGVRLHPESGLHRQLNNTSPSTMASFYLTSQRRVCGRSCQ
jgi:hypothetical protein